MSSLNENSPVGKSNWGVSFTDLDVFIQLDRLGHPAVVEAEVEVDAGARVVGLGDAARGVGRELDAALLTLPHHAVLGVTAQVEHAETHHHIIRLPLNQKLFPVHRPSGLKGADWNFFRNIFIFIFFLNLFPQYIQVYTNMKLKKKKRFPTDRLAVFFTHQVDRKRLFTYGWP